MRNLALALVVAMLCFEHCAADLFIHYPPGSTNRNRERANNANRNNGDSRLFDSQSNSNGGYHWRGDPELAGKADPLEYIVGSKMHIEFTDQHGCGTGSNSNCQLILQYACDDTLPGLRDGYPTGEVTDDPGLNNNEQSDNPDFRFKVRRFKHNTPNGNTVSGTERIPWGRSQEFYDGKPDVNGTAAGVEYGMHENYEWYKKRCFFTERNKGLWTADQLTPTQNNKHRACYTVQDQNACDRNQRDGFECPEEKDFYPWWGISPWKDIVIMVDDKADCDYYVQHSQNTEGRWYCECDITCQNSYGQSVQDQPFGDNPAQNGEPYPEEDKHRLTPISRSKCETHGGEWTWHTSKDIDAPDCLESAKQRDNHLGNVDHSTQDKENHGKSEGENPTTAGYWWTVPEDAVGRQCVIRARYNISTQDVGSRGFLKGKVYGASNNCKKGQAGCRVHTDPQVNLYTQDYINDYNIDEDMSKIDVRLNGDQIQRTFQDRSHVFKVIARPSGVSEDAVIWNLGVRGMRDNIVNSYPAVEYDFVPIELHVEEGDYVHVQMHGSNFNQASNNGEGMKYTGRHNLMQVDESRSNFPMPLDKQTMWPNIEIAEDLALLKQHSHLNGSWTACYPYASNQGDQARDNCAKLNAAPAKFSKLIKMDGVEPGRYVYASTRGNNFSNRSQKGALHVHAKYHATWYLAVVGAAVAGTGAITLAAMAFWIKKSPDGCLAQRLDSCRQSRAARAQMTRL